MSSKMHIIKKPPKQGRRDPVAKAMFKLTRPATHKNPKLDYERRPKHRKPWGDAFWEELMLHARHQGGMDRMDRMDRMNSVSSPNRCTSLRFIFFGSFVL